MILVNATKKVTLCDRCHFANTVVKRMVGLLSRSKFEPGEGLLFDRCYGIHTIGMRFPIDVLFLDKDYRVIRAVNSLPPFRTCTVRKAIYVLELPAGTIEQTGTETGDQVQIRTTLRPEPVVPIVPAAEPAAL
jgi:uncharacterized membrane protein (UPF0127 family)